MLKLRGRKVTVLGMGRSAVGAARLLVREGALPFVSEVGDSPPELYRQALDAMEIPYEVGGHSARAWDTELAVVSPGVPAGLPALSALRERGIPVMGELELGYLFCKSRILAVTGTNGKTTTTELLRHLIAHCGHTVALAGNNALPLCEAVLENPAPKYMVLEVSSYQLETVWQFRPWIAAALNLTPDHLGRHQTMEAYAEAKARIFRRQRDGDAAVLNRDDDWTAEMGVPDEVRLLSFSVGEFCLEGLWADSTSIYDRMEVVAQLSDNPLPGKHNLYNVLAALTMLRAGKFDWSKCIEGLRTFTGVEHRLEFVAEHQSVQFYNDSKSTNVDSLRVALESFEQPIVLIAGGQGKAGSDYAALGGLLRQRVQTAVLLGEEAPKMAEAWSGIVPISLAGSMEEAVALARSTARANAVVLLSPGCASFDMYRNFEERGRDFKACVAGLAKV